MIFHQYVRYRKNTTSFKFWVMSKTMEAIKMNKITIYDEDIIET